MWSEAPSHQAPYGPPNDVEIDWPAGASSRAEAGQSPSRPDTIPAGAVEPPSAATPFPDGLSGLALVFLSSCLAEEWGQNNTKIPCRNLGFAFRYEQCNRPGCLENHFTEFGVHGDEQRWTIVIDFSKS